MIWRLGVRRWAEGIALLLTAAGAAFAVSWPWLRTAARTLPLDAAWDPMYFSWQMAWVGHALRHPGQGLWTTPAFGGEPDNLAFTDTVLGYAPLSLLTGQGVPGAVRGYNLAIAVAAMTAFVGAYALARLLGAHPAGALVAGAGFAFAPWRIQHINHINVLSTGGMALTLALLVAGHGWSLRHGWRPERMRASWVLAGWLVACWQLTFGFALGVVFGYAVATVMLLLTGMWVWRGRARIAAALRGGRRARDAAPEPDGRPDAAPEPDGRPDAAPEPDAAAARRPLPRPWAPLTPRFLAAEVAGVLAFLGTAGLLVRPYLRVLAAHPSAARAQGYLDLFSPPPIGYLVGPEGGLWYNDAHAPLRQRMGWPNEMALLPGYVLILLALVGLLVSCWALRRRLVLAAVVVAVGVLSLGIRGPAGGRYTFLPLWQYLPGWNTIRTPGRLVIWVTLGLCLLAAGAVSFLAERLIAAARTRAGRREPTLPWWAALPLPLVLLMTVLMAVPAGLIAAEGRVTGAVRDVSAPPYPSGLPDPLLVLPSRANLDYQTMLWSTDGWPRLLNGSSGFESQRQQFTRAQVAGFPDAASVYYLRSRGVRTVVAVRHLLAGTSWSDLENMPFQHLGITRREYRDSIVFGL